MRYLVSKHAMLKYPDGSTVELEPGIHEHPDNVAKHWAFAHYASPIDDPEEKGKPGGKKQQASN